jgi:hypothetical protein
MKCAWIKIICALAILMIAVCAEAGGRIRFLCSDENGNKYFTQKANQNCLMNVLEDGWLNISGSPNVVADVMPSTMVREQDGTKVWTQIFLPSAVSGGDWSYNYMKGVSKFYCGKRQTRLIQATYVLDGKRVYERGSPESIIEEIEPGTVNDDIYSYVCKK